jgi:hypothetical protein
VVEDAQAQTFTPKPNQLPPLTVNGLGLEADWFPQYPDLMATDGYRLVTVTVTWDHVRQRELRAIAVAVTRPYMHPPVGQKAINKLLYGDSSG